MADETEVAKIHNGINWEELNGEAKGFFTLNKSQIGEVSKIGGKVVKVDFEELSEYSPTLSDLLIEKPEETIEHLNIALEELDWAPKNAKIRLTSISESQNIFIRNIRAVNLGKLICIEGIVRQASEVRPLITNAKFECPSCGTFISVYQFDKKFKEPTRCSCGRRGGFKLVGKEMVDAQTIRIEEASDNLSGGEQPKRIIVTLKEDLVEPKMESRTTPGSRVKVIGVLKEIQIFSSNGTPLTNYDLQIDANNVIPMDESFEDINVNEEDERQIKELATDPEIVNKLVKSIAPSIWGYDNVKKALTLQLFGGVQKPRGDGSFTRGDIHILLVGDPGVAKSVMLSYIAKTAPKARYISGKSTTGAGITASVVKDEILKNWGLEAGAMVLANKGIVCVDEFDKMDEEDRSAMHEAMEQQTVTISKATVQATLRSQTSVLAAANPKFGRFNPNQPIAKQVNLVPSLLSRFDSIFIMRDIPRKDRDESIAMHVLKGHQLDNVRSEVIDRDLLRKYISYAKQKCHPELTDEAIEEMKNFYVGLRSQAYGDDSADRAIPIGARQLEALVRLAEANAKIRLSKEVRAYDAKVAIDVVKSYLLEVGLDQETNQIDIDKISGERGITASKRNKINVIREEIENLSKRLGKRFPVEELKKAVEGKVSNTDFETVMEELKKAGDFYMPRSDEIQLI